MKSSDLENKRETTTTRNNADNVTGGTSLNPPALNLSSNPVQMQVNEEEEQVPHGSQLGTALGADLSGVEAHTSTAANVASQSMGARSFAEGNHTALSSTDNMNLAAHEMTHVVQSGDKKDEE